MNTMETEYETAVAALISAGLDKEQAANAVMKFQTTLPEAAAEDLVQIALQSAILGKMNEGLFPKELKAYLPQLGTILEQMGKFMKLPGLPWISKK